MYKALIDGGEIGMEPFRLFLFRHFMKLRWAMNNFANPMIFYFIFTIDNDFEEKCLDLVKDFTALLILVDLDNMMSFEDPVPNYNIMEVL